MNTHTYIYIHVWREELYVYKIFIMPGFSVNYQEVWKDVSSVEFVNQKPSSEYDWDSVQGLMNLIREALEVLRHPEHLSQAQIQDLEAKVKQLNAQLTRESTLARRVDPSVPWYPVRWGWSWNKKTAYVVGGLVIEFHRWIKAESLQFISNIVIIKFPKNVPTEHNHIEGV